VTHPLYGSEVIFDSWTTLCEHTMDLAEDEAKRQLMDELIARTGLIADEMVKSAEEIDG
jgi:hypothetical protein